MKSRPQNLIEAYWYCVTRFDDVIMYEALWQDTVDMDVTCPHINSNGVFVDTKNYWNVYHSLYNIISLIINQPLKKIIFPKKMTIAKVIASFRKILCYTYGQLSLNYYFQTKKLDCNEFAALALTGEYWKISTKVTNHCPFIWTYRIPPHRKTAISRGIAIFVTPFNRSPPTACSLIQ